MDDNLKTLIARCVKNNHTFRGTTGVGVYTVQDIMNNNVNLPTIEKLFDASAKKLDAKGSRTLGSKTSIANTSLKLTVDTLEAVYNYRVSESERLAAAKLKREEKRRLLGHLQNLKGEKELEVLGKLTPEQIDEKIAELTA